MRPQSDLWVVVPCYNEEKRIAETLRALAAQTDDDFTLLIVDNGSTDGTRAALADFFAAIERITPFVGARLDAPSPDCHRPQTECDDRGVGDGGSRSAPTDYAPSYSIITETQKGTGAASDTGFRHAIAQGARWVARTDADCLPAPDWIARIRRAFVVEGLEFVAGRIVPRDDDEHLTPLDRVLIPAIVGVSHILGRLRRHGTQFKYPYFVVAGNNLAITADLYLRAGGFPRTAIEEAHEDRALAERVRTLTARARLDNRMVVSNSTRRLKRYGYVATLLWYFDHLRVPEEVDVR